MSKFGRRIIGEDTIGDDRKVLSLLRLVADSPAASRASPAATAWLPGCWFFGVHPAHRLRLQCVGHEIQRRL